MKVASKLSARTGSHPCGCFVKVYVCPEHLQVAGRELRELTSQLELCILDNVGSVSALVEGEDTQLLFPEGRSNG